MEGDDLSYELEMAMEGVARTFHVRAPPEGRTVAGGHGDLSRVWLATRSSEPPGGVLWLLDLRDAANVAGAATTAVALVSLLRDVVEGILRREAGVDVIALLAMGGSLALEEYLAGARDRADARHGGSAPSATRIAERTGSSRRSSTVRPER